jgi:small conductance mechanosensitive channel
VRQLAGSEKGETMEEQLRLLDQVWDAAVDLAIKFGPRVLVAAAILVAGYFAGRWAARALGRALRTLHLEPPVLALVTRIAHLLVLGLFLIKALQNLGVELLPLIAGLGIAGAGIALAMQGVLGNREGGGRGAGHLAFQHHAGARRSLARGHPEPQDRRRDPA